MVLTSKVKDEMANYFFELGDEPEDLKQLFDAVEITKYKIEENGVDKPISRDEVINLLGLKTYCSGIHRSAFHWTATRYVNDAEGMPERAIFFDSSELFADF